MAQVTAGGVHRENRIIRRPTRHYSKVSCSLLTRLLVILLVTSLALRCDSTPPTPPLGQALVLSGVVGELERDQQSARLRLLEPVAITTDGSQPLGRPLRVTFDYLDPPPAVGSVIRLDAVLERVRAPRNPTTAPRREPPLYARALTSPVEEPERAPSWTTRVALALRDRLRLESAGSTALFRALLLGDRSDLDAEMRYALQDTGTVHLLAISGMHLALIGWGLFRSLLLLLVGLARLPGVRHLGPAALVQGGRPRRLAAALAFVVTAGYTAVITPSDGTQRALVALAVVMLGILVLRASTAWRVLGACLAATIALDPEALLGAGCQLSFAAATSLVIIAPHLGRINARIRARVRRRWARRLIFFLVALVVANLACSLATAPLTVAWFGQLSVPGLWVNLVAVPLLTLLVFPVAAAWLLVAMVVPPLGDAFAPLVSALGEQFDALVHLAGDASGLSSTEAWPLALGLFATLSMLALMTLNRRLVRAGAVALGLTSLLALPPTSPPSGLTLTALDVGHGDALALALPDGTRVLVDTGGRQRYRAFGGDPNRYLAEGVLVPALRASGFSSIDLLVLTHADLDHVGALSALARRISIRHLWLPPCARSPSLDAALVALEAAGTRIHRVARGPPQLFGGATFEILGPASTIGRRCPSDNDASLVLRVGYAGRHLLLTGDIEALAEAELLQVYDSAELRADVLKVPHHGSRTSSTDAFLDAVDPSTAIISGRIGRRPPPHPSVLTSYQRRGISTYVTGLGGAVRVTIDPEGHLITGL